MPTRYWEAAYAQARRGSDRPRDRRFGERGRLERREPNFTTAAGRLFTPDLFADPLDRAEPRPGEQSELFRALERFDLKIEGQRVASPAKTPAAEAVTRVVPPEESHRTPFGLMAWLRAAWRRWAS